MGCDWGPDLAIEEKIMVREVTIDQKSRGIFMNTLAYLPAEQKLSSAGEMKVVSLMYK